MKMNLNIKKWIFLVFALALVGCSSNKKPRKIQVHQSQNGGQSGQQIGDEEYLKSLQDRAVGAVESDLRLDDFQGVVRDFLSFDGPLDYELGEVSPSGDALNHIYFGLDLGLKGSNQFPSVAELNSRKDKIALVLSIVDDIALRESDNPIYVFMPHGTLDNVSLQSGIYKFEFSDASGKIYLNAKYDSDFLYGEVTYEHNGKRLKSLGTFFIPLSYL